MDYWCMRDPKMICDPEYCDPDYDCPLNKSKKEIGRLRGAINAIPRIPHIASYEQCKIFRDEMMRWDDDLKTQTSLGETETK